MPTLAVYQGYYNGLLFGPGTDVRYDSYDGFNGLTTVRTGDMPFPRSDGVLPGFNYLDERVVTLNLRVFAPVQPIATVLAAIGAAFQNRPDPNDLLPLMFLQPGWANPRQILCRPTSGQYPIDVSYQANNVPIPIELTGPIPTIFDSVVSSNGPVGLPSPTAGATFPITFNMTFGASTGGILTATNTGTTPTPPVFTITGPCTNPSVTLVSTGEFMECDLSLGPTDILVIDMGAKTVELNGVSRFNTIASGSSFFQLPSGTSTIDVSSTDSAAVAATFEVEWQNAWEWT